MAEAPHEAGGKSTARRDLLLSLQEQAQRLWEEEKVFEVDAPVADSDDDLLSGKPGEKFFVNFPYPYMNGMLHLGHAFSLSKAEFASAYKRLKGERVLFPFGYHCTGMPIKACADKLEREITTYGDPPNFDIPQKVADASENAASTPAAAEDGSADAGPPAGQSDPTKFKGKKSKAAAKAGTAAHQWDIMRMSGIPDEQISSFRDAKHWLKYFPPHANKDLKVMGCGVDWRRSFITTDMNPYYDAFIRWQFNTLKKIGKVVKDKRYTIYSPLDGQPCADHDRASGEGVQPVDYTLIKMRVVEPLPAQLAALEGKKVFMAAATLRPETMYGQTNAWVLPDGDYGAYQINDEEVFIITARSALNLSYQGYSPEPGKPKLLLELKGSDLLGLALNSPLSVNPVIYALPMLTILTDKGTGVVTSVPSDAPDDYAALMDLVNKPALRAKFNIKDEWVLPFKVVPIINIPEFGDEPAVKVCTDLGIKSQNDKEKLATAKRMTYLKGFTEGVMIIGPYAGRRVQEVKPIIRKELIDAGLAAPYSEPESKVMSRSGDECVVALTDQWYLIYGEENWREQALKALGSMELFHVEARNQFEAALGWLNQWACSRSFGLGTRMPWDDAFLIESLSDSTIYMAYYTIAHFLQDGDIYGSPEGKKVSPDQLTDEIFDHIFLDGRLPTDTRIDPSLLQAMRREFNYWYPFDLRVSGKDLIQNHLTFAIYNHTAIFPEKHWPLAYRVNGHLLLNSEKMSKSTGNFKTLRDAMAEYSSDAMRFALADAGDSMEDANFLEDTANAAILKLTKELAWMEEGFEGKTQLRTGEISTFADKVFQNEINVAITLTKENMDKMVFRDALKSGFYDFQNARDEYRVSCGTAGIHEGLAKRFIEVQTLMLTPFTPHFSEHVWRNVLKKPKTVLRAGWPVADSPDFTLQRANGYLQDCVANFRKLSVKAATAGVKSKAKKGQDGAPPPPPVKLTRAKVFVAEKFGGWQELCLKVLQSHYDEATGSFSPDSEIIEAVKKEMAVTGADFKTISKNCMPFVKFKKDEASKVGKQALEVKLPFDELAILEENSEYMRRALNLEEFSVTLSSDEEALKATDVDPSRAAAAVPGQPIVLFLAPTSTG